MPRAVVAAVQASISKCRIAETAKPTCKLSMGTKSVVNSVNERPCQHLPCNTNNIKTHDFDQRMLPFSGICCGYVLPYKEEHDVTRGTQSLFLKELGLRMAPLKLISLETRRVGRGWCCAFKPRRNASYPRPSRPFSA